jgi:hypothetical protein
MRLVTAGEPGQVELNYMWLPTFLGLNSALMKEIQDVIGPGLIGQPLTDETLDRVHGELLDFFEKKFPNLEGLRDYLDGLKFVRPA